MGEEGLNPGRLDLKYSSMLPSTEDFTSSWGLGNLKLPKNCVSLSIFPKWEESKTVISLTGIKGVSGYNVGPQT